MNVRQFGERWIMCFSFGPSVTVKLFSKISTVHGLKIIEEAVEYTELPQFSRNLLRKLLHHDLRSGILTF